MKSRAGVHVQSGLLSRLKGALWAVGTVFYGVSRTTLTFGKVVRSVGPSLDLREGWIEYSKAIKLFVYKRVIEIASSVFFSKENELLFDNFD